MADNKEKHAPISIRFNGEKHTLEEWTQKETAADKEHMLDWSEAFPKMQAGSADAPEKEAANKNVKKHLRFFPVQQELPPVKKFFRTLHVFWLPATAAIVIGLAIGLTMLILFSGQKQQTSSTWERNNATTVSGQVASINKNDLQITAYFLQAGVYSTKAKAEAAAAILRSKGLAVLSGGSNETVLFIGAASGSSGAQRLAAYYKNQNVPVYQKQLRFQPASDPEVLHNNQNAQFARITRAIIMEMAQNAIIESGSKIHPDKKVSVKIAELSDQLQKINVQTSNRQLASLSASIKTAVQNAVSRTVVSVKGQTGPQFASYQKALLELIALYQGMIDLPAAASEK